MRVNVQKLKRLREEQVLSQRELARMAGLTHATISQTMDTYSHVVPGMGRVAVDALEEALG